MNLLHLGQKGFFELGVGEWGVGGLPREGLYDVNGHEIPLWPEDVVEEEEVLAAPPAPNFPSPVPWQPNLKNMGKPTKDSQLPQPAHKIINSSTSSQRNAELEEILEEEGKASHQPDRIRIQARAAKRACQTRSKAAKHRKKQTEAQGDVKQVPTETSKAPKVGSKGGPPLKEPETINQFQIHVVETAKSGARPKRTTGGTNGRTPRARSTKRRETHADVPLTRREYFRKELDLPCKAGRKPVLHITRSENQEAKKHMAKNKIKNQNHKFERGKQRDARRILNEILLDYAEWLDDMKVEDNGHMTIRKWLFPYYKSMHDLDLKKSIPKVIPGVVFAD